MIIQGKMLKDLKMEISMSRDQEKIVPIVAKAVYMGRQSGNTTRQIDFAIQILFEGHIVKVRDHSGIRQANQDLFRRIMRRLEFEHNLTVRHPDSAIKRLEIDHKNLEIEIIG